MTRLLNITLMRWCRWAHKGAMLGVRSYECPRCGRAYAYPWVPEHLIEDGVWRVR